jgi:catechol 2,3-dioxygenase-like lactoylglutathione lyase family enzyme
MGSLWHKQTSLKSSRDPSAHSTNARTRNSLLGYSTKPRFQLPALAPWAGLWFVRCCVMELQRTCAGWPVFPALAVKDVASSVTWYRVVFGFEVVSQSHCRCGVTVAHLRWAGYAGLLLVADQSRSPHCSLGPTGIRYYFWTERDVYELASKSVQLGAAIVSGPVTHPWGIREVAFCDPDGYQLVFCQRLCIAHATTNYRWVGRPD